MLPTREGGVNHHIPKVRGGALQGEATLKHYGSRVYRFLLGFLFSGFFGYVSKSSIAVSYSSCFFLDSVSLSPGCPQTHCVAKNDFELLALLHRPPPG